MAWKFVNEQTCPYKKGDLIRLGDRYFIFYSFGDGEYRYYYRCANRNQFHQTTMCKVSKMITKDFRLTKSSATTEELCAIKSGWAEIVEHNFDESKLWKPKSGLKLLKEI